MTAQPIESESAIVLEHPTRSRARRPRKPLANTNKVATSASTIPSSTIQTSSVGPRPHAYVSGVSTAPSSDVRVSPSESTLHELSSNLRIPLESSIEPSHGLKRSTTVAISKLVTESEAGHVRGLLHGLNAYHRKKAQEPSDFTGFTKSGEALIRSSIRDTQSLFSSERQWQELAMGTYLVQGRDLVRLKEHDNAIFQDESLLVCSKPGRYLWHGPGINIASIKPIVRAQNTTPVIAGYEPEELVSALHTIIYHLGPRKAFDLRKPRLYMVYNRQNGFIIEEKVLDSSRLCSGFVFVVLSSAKTYLWQGDGARDSEVQAGQEFILSFTSRFESLQEASENQSFWKLFNSDMTYARTAYWKLKKLSCYRSVLYLENEFEHFERRELWTFADLKSTAYTTIVDAYFEIYITLPDRESSMKAALQRAIVCVNTRILKDLVDRPFPPVVLLLCHNSRLPRDLEIIVPFAQPNTRLPLRLFEVHDAMGLLEQGLSSQLIMCHA